MITRNRSRWAFALLVVVLLSLGFRDYRLRNEAQQLQSRVNRLEAELKAQQDISQETYMRLATWEMKYPQQAEKIRKQRTEIYGSPPALEQRGLGIPGAPDGGATSVDRIRLH